MKRILFIINPISGVEGKQNLPNLIATYLNQDLFSYEITYTQYRHHAKEITRAANHADHVDGKVPENYMSCACR